VICLPFHDRIEAGRALAHELRRLSLRLDAVAFGIAPGGMPVAFEVADRLRLPLDAIVVRELDVPWQPELMLGAIAGDIRVLDDNIVETLNISADEIEEAVQGQIIEASRCEELYRQCSASTSVTGRTALIVDDGISSGISMIAAIRYIRSFAPKEIVVGVPVGSREGCRRAGSEADEFVCLATPEQFCAVGEWYREYADVDDDCVQRYLRANRLSLRRKLVNAVRY
jgi:putative phosphoribosyl transferase